MAVIRRIVNAIAPDAIRWPPLASEDPVWRGPALLLINIKLMSALRDGQPAWLDLD